ncbi:hypothetical protein E2C01_007479 [Portunus trituberculatus]|uniref:Uncharacterized protein n=1 Tax=Portunus trituberculatus TaxID=210409 RepID=A0A5B7CZJ7_PORTR|nr:hypothetical protein [Portunus trituberculatus]
MVACPPRTLTTLSTAIFPRNQGSPSPVEPLDKYKIHGNVATVTLSKRSCFFFGPLASRLEPDVELTGAQRILRMTNDKRLAWLTPNSLPMTLNA